MKPTFTETVGIGSAYAESEEKKVIVSLPAVQLNNVGFMFHVYAVHGIYPLEAGNAEKSSAEGVSLFPPCTVLLRQSRGPQL